MDSGERQKEELEKTALRHSTQDWVVFLSATFVMLTNMGYMASLGAVFPYILDEFQDNRASTAAIQSTFFGVGHCSGLFIGIIVQRNGPRYGGVFGATLYAGGMIVSSFASSTIYLLVSLGIVTGLGYGFLYISCNQALGQCFQGQARLVAVAIGITAIGVGSMVYPYVVDWLVLYYGLHGMFLILGGVLLNAIPLAFTWSNSKKKCNASGDSALDNTAQSCPAKSSRSCGICTSFLQTLRCKPFCFLLFGLTLSLTAMLVFEILSLDIFETKGMTRDQSISAYVAMQSAGIPGRFFPVLVNKIPRCSSAATLAAGLVLGGIGMIALNYIVGYIGSIILYFLTGISKGIMITCMSVTTLEMLGTSRFATGLGLILCLSGILTSVSGPFTGFLRDVSGSYISTLYLTAGSVFLAAILCFISMTLHNRHQSRKKGQLTEDVEIENAHHDQVYTITRL